MVTENADSDVRRDLENFISTLVLDGDPVYLHDQEGPDDMAAHIRSVLTQTDITIPITAGKMALGTWYLARNISLGASNTPSPSKAGHHH